MGGLRQPRFCLERRYHAPIMVHFPNAMQVTRLAIVAIIVTVSFSTAFMVSAQARGGGHGYGRSFFGHGGMHGANIVGDRRHGNDTYVKEAEDERDKLLTTKIADRSSHRPTTIMSSCRVPMLIGELS